MSSANASTVPGTHDGSGAGDCDLPYQFGRRPRTADPLPFTTRQFARLLVLRSQIGDGLFGAGDVAASSDAVGRGGLTSSRA
jgi:hypothetical protein